MHRKLEAELAKLDPEKYPLLSFCKGINPKKREEQWEARRNGKKYVLDRIDARTYNDRTGAIRTFVRMELVPFGRVLLVEKLEIRVYSDRAAAYARGTHVAEVTL